MAKQGISTGTNPNDGTGDSLLTGAVKINGNFSLNNPVHHSSVMFLKNDIF